MIDVVVNKSYGVGADAALLTFSGGPAVAGRLHQMVLYVARLDDPGLWLEVTPFDLVPAGGETPDQAAAAFDGFINAYPRYESTTTGGVMQIEPKSRENYIEVAYLIDGVPVEGSYNPQPQPINIVTNLPTVFVDDAAIAARTAEVPDATWNSGMLGGGGAGPGVGISNQENQLQQALMPPTDGTPLVDSGVGSWSLLDQHGNARSGQIGQNIGGSGYTDPADYPSSGGQEGTLPDSTIRWQPIVQDGLGTLNFPAPNTELATLQEGWRQQP
jgi:hypothetical protein